MAALLLATSPVAGQLPGEEDAAALMDLATGELVFTHHPAALGHAHPPGSTFKLVTTYAALGRHVDPARAFRCEGSAVIAGEERRCWDPAGHGMVDLGHALAVSCNLYFYRLGAELPPGSVLGAARAFGLGRSTFAGVDAESAGVVPSELDPRDAPAFAAGDTTLLEVTPLQMLQVAAAIARRGVGPAPRLAGRGQASPGLQLDDTGAIDFLREGMREAGEIGTLGGTELSTIDGAGKTGTAAWIRGGYLHAWFIGFAPFEAPRFAVVVFADKGHGAKEAAEPGVALLEQALGVPVKGAAAPPTDGPLRIRVLEKAKPTRAQIQTSTGKLSCDGKPLDLVGASLEIDGGRIDFGRANVRCRELLAPGPLVSLKGNPFNRGYRGAVIASVIESHLAFVNVVDVEDYLRGVVADEMSFDRPQALQAQAVVSRTYALASRGRHQKYGYDLCDLTHCQLYRGTAGERFAASQAVDATRGKVVRHGGALLPTYFHSTCGGATSSPIDIFHEPQEEPGVPDVDGSPAPLCAEAPSFEWSWDVARDDLARALNVPPRGEAIRLLDRDRGGRVLALEAFGVPMTGERLHALVGRAFGFQALKSLKVSAREEGGRVRFSGNGLGHGVGLCQYGAYELDHRGRDWKYILKHYFPEGVVGP